MDSDTEDKPKWVSYAECKKFVHSLTLRDITHWRQYTKNNVLPEGIPKNPRAVYGKEYKGDADLLGHETYYTYTVLSIKIKKYGFGSEREYRQWHMANNPQKVPKRPDRMYEAEWEGWPKFLGKKKRAFRPYEDAIRYAHALGIKDKPHWLNYCASGKKPSDIPSLPDKIYKAKWVSWPEWLGTKLEVVIKHKQNNFTHILYLYVEEGEVDNVISIGIEPDGITAVKQKQQEENFRLLKMYRYDPSKHHTVEQIINNNGTAYYEATSQFIITNVHQLLWDMMCEFEIVTKY